VQWGIEHRQLGPIVAIGVDVCQRRMKTPQKCRLKIPQAG
jgi:hypothetical protein